MVAEIENEFNNYDKYNVWGPVFQVKLQSKYLFWLYSEWLDFRMKTVRSLSCRVKNNLIRNKLQRDELICTYVLSLYIICSNIQWTRLRFLENSSEKE